MPLLLLALAAATAGPQQQATPGAILLDRNRADRNQPVAPPTPAQAPSAPVSVTAAANDAAIAGIRFIGAKAPAPVARAARAFIGKPATGAVLARLAAALSVAYAHSAVALYTVAIPRQTFAGHVLIVHLTEGRVAHAAVKASDGRAHPLLARRLARLTQEAPLSRATWERQLTLARAIPGLTVDPQLTDPEHTGALDLTATARHKRVNVTAGFTNRGVDLLGEGQFDVRAEGNSLGIDGDQTVLSASAASDLKAFRTVSASYQAPVTASGLTAGASIAYLETRPRGYPVTGTAGQAGVSLSYPLIRSFARSADASLSFDGLNSDAAAFGAVISREHSRAVRAAASYTVASAKRSFSIAGSLSKGLDVLGGRADPLYADLGFTKVVGGASIGQAIGKRWVVRVSGSGQFSDDRVPAAERFAIGGAAIGRAFDTAVLTGDRGAGGSGELAWRPLRKGSFTGSELYGFVDGGGVYVLQRGVYAAQNYRLASTGVGVRARYKTKAELGLEAAHAIVRPDPLRAEDWRLLVSWRLSTS